MSKAKKVLLSLAAVAALALGAVKAKERMDYIHEGTPYLVGHCFLMKEDGSALLLPKTVEATRQDTGKEETVYLGVISLMGGLIQLPMPLEIRSTNEAIKKLKAEDKIQEVNCETGEPLTK